MRIVIAALALLSTQALADERVSPTLDLSAVMVEVTWVASSDELAALRTQYESRTANADAGQQQFASSRLGGRRPRETGFSVLGKRDGQYVCLLFVLRPINTNDGRTTAIGHELLHCLLGDYHP
jgi:hypothetical protein